MGMVDIHNHLIYRFDDGPQTLEESLEMLRIADSQGISDVFATSHFSEFIHPNIERDYFQKLEILREEALARDYEIIIHSGSELFFHHFLEETIRKSKVATLGGLGRYVLIEFPLFLMPDGVEEVLFKLSMADFIPIIAHTERYQGVLSKPRTAIDFTRYGALLQVNAGSIVGDFGKEVQKISMWLLENKMVHFIASDAHTTRNRTFKLVEAVEFLEDKIEKEYIRELVETNPKRIINNVQIEILKVSDSPPPQGLFQKLRNRFKFN